MKKQLTSYETFLKSAEWKNRKIQHYRSKQNQVCYCCGSKKKLCVHHIRYSQPWGKEKQRDLITLCETCHNIIHRELSKPNGKISKEHKRLRKKIRKKRGLSGFTEAVAKEKPHIRFSRPIKNQTEYEYRKRFLDSVMSRKRSPADTEIIEKLVISIKQYEK